MSRLPPAATIPRPERTPATMVILPPPASPEAGLARSFVRGSIVGFVAVFVVLGGMVGLLGLGLGPSIGIGLFTAVWGGPGFGGMLAAVLHYSREQERLRPTAHGR